MLRNLSILLALAFAGCSHPTERTEAMAQTLPASVAILAGFSVIEQQPDGYFIRLASVERASKSSLRTLAYTFNGKFDRIDLCLDIANNRGDEYASIIGYQVFDYENDDIYTLHVNEPISLQSNIAPDSNYQ